MPFCVETLVARRGVVGQWPSWPSRAARDASIRRVSALFSVIFWPCSQRQYSQRCGLTLMTEDCAKTVRKMFPFVFIVYPVSSRSCGNVMINGSPALPLSRTRAHTLTTTYEGVNLQIHSSKSLTIET